MPAKQLKHRNECIMYPMGKQTGNKLKSLSSLSHWVCSIVLKGKSSYFNSRDKLVKLVDVL